MKQVFGAMLMGVGILIAGASGLCTVVLGLGEIFASGSREDVGVGVVLVVGSIPFVIGLAAFFGGRALVRRGDSAAAKKAARKTQESGNQEPTATPTKENR